jgi:putative hydrolase of the HAD superfamily
MKMVKGIYFDAVGTLIHPEPAVAVVYAEAARRFGSRYDADAIAQRFGIAFQAQEALDRANGWLTDEERERSRWRQIVGTVLDDAADPTGCFDFLYGHFAKPGAWRCDAQAEALFEYLERRGYLLGLASNFDKRLYDLIRGLKPLQRLANVIISSEVGVRKPAPEFFHFMCRQAGLAAAHILHVGDDPVNDYAGAQAAGLQALLFDPLGKHAGESAQRIRSLGDLREALSASNSRVGERGVSVP